MQDNYFVKTLKLKMDEYVHVIYRLTRGFPREEMYNVTSQIRRAALSVILNDIEGFARQKQLVKKNFWEIVYGSLKESKYLLFFSLKENYINKEDYDLSMRLADEIGAMIWKSIIFGMNYVKMLIC